MDSSPTVSGLNLCILMSALVWVKDCPFTKTDKPKLEMAGQEMDQLYTRLASIWNELRDARGVQEARAEKLMLEMNSRELRCLHACLRGVLQECEGNPLELELRVGDLVDVQRLARECEWMTQQ